MSNLSALTEAIKRGDRNAATDVTREALAARTAPQAIFDALVAGMDDVGQRFKCNEVFVPEVLIAARAMKESMALLEPRLLEAGIRPEFTAVIGTVQGDLHDIGKNLVAMLWKGAGFEVIDLGTNVQPRQFIEAAEKHAAQIIGLSALLTTTMMAMKTTIDAIRAASLDAVKIVIGGAPITEQFASEIGADGYARDAASAVDVARDLLSR